VKRRDFFDADSKECEIAQCLVCGKRLVLSKKGICCAHAEKCSGGSGGIFLLVQLGRVLVIRRSHAATVPSPFTDQYGENSYSQMRGRLLYLDHSRLEHLRRLWAEGQLSAQVVRLRDAAQRVIINGYY
jgi:hypothetical protein